MHAEPLAVMARSGRDDGFGVARIDRHAGKERVGEIDDHAGLRSGKGMAYSRYSKYSVFLASLNISCYFIESIIHSGKEGDVFSFIKSVSVFEYLLFLSKLISKAFF
jgi:hypothetical protein